MKVGPAQGSPQEITDFFENHGMDPSKYFTESEQRLSRIWFVIPSVIIIIIFALLTLMDSLTPGTQNFAFLIGCGASLWLATNLQLRYTNPWATGFVLLVMLLLMLVAIGVLTPKELLEAAKIIQSD